MSPSSARFVGLISCAVMTLSLSGCSSSRESAEQTKAETSSGTDASSPAGKASASTAPFVPLDACSLLTRADVEAIAGKTVLDGRKEEVANLVSCSFGDPSAPQVGGRSLGQVLTLSVMTGQEGTYYAGAVAQAKDAYLTARKNAGSVEAISGLGEDAYWDNVLHKLSFVKGRYLVDVDVESEGDSRKVARAAATKTLERLPQ